MTGTPIDAMAEAKALCAAGERVAGVLQGPGSVRLASLAGGAVAILRSASEGPFPAAPTLADAVQQSKTAGCGR